VFCAYTFVVFFLIRTRLVWCHCIDREVRHEGDHPHCSLSRWGLDQLRGICRMTLLRVTALQTEKKSRLLQTKLQALCRTNAHLLIQILREHPAWKMNYSTNKVQVSWAAAIEFPDYTNSLTFPRPGPNSQTSSVNSFPDYGHKPNATKAAFRRLLKTFWFAQH